MNQTYPLFVGYPRLEELLQSVNRKSGPVFSMLSSEPGKAEKFGLITRSMIVTVAQPEVAGGIVHYCRLPAGQMRYIEDQPFERDHERRVKNAERLWNLVDTWLGDKGLEIRHGTIATPQNMRFLDGWADWLEIDPATQEYKRKGENVDH